MTESTKPEPKDHIARELLERVEREDDGLVLEFDRYGNIVRDHTPHTETRERALTE